MVNWNLSWLYDNSIDSLIEKWNRVSLCAMSEISSEYSKISVSTRNIHTQDQKMNGLKSKYYNMYYPEIKII